MKREIKNATAIYTGGNIYIYYGQLLDGNWFRATDGEEFIEICDSDTSVEEADYYEFYEEHSIETLTDEEYKKFWNEMLLWIIHNAPEGNYQTDELERRMIKMAKYYTVTVNFGGYFGCENTYVVYADDEDDAIEQARELALEDCSFEVDEDEDDEEEN